jgi:opacity protein-like surface antigen
MRAVKVALAAAILASLLVVASVALAADVPKPGKVNVYVTPRPDNSGAGTIVITGAIGDYGKTQSIDKNGKKDPNGVFQKVTLKRGTFVVDTTALDKKLNSAPFKPNPATCSANSSVTAPTSLSKGTGLYFGIGGSVKITVTFAAIAPRYTSGAKKGQCNFSNNAPALAQFSSITGVGSVTFLVTG